MLFKEEFETEKFVTDLLETGTMLNSHQMIYINEEDMDFLKLSHLYFATSHMTILNQLFVGCNGAWE